jgi:hypothetical protein
MDSVMLGSLHTYRRWIKTLLNQKELPLFGHGCAGAMAGFTVSFIACPIEHVKVSSLPPPLTQARLQVQYSSADRLYTGPLDAYKKIVFSPVVKLTEVYVPWYKGCIYRSLLHNHVSLCLFRMVVYL